MNPISKAKGQAIVGLSTMLVAGCARNPDQERAPTVAADMIYAGGDIVTVNDAQPTA